MITIIQYTYRDDAELTLISARQARRALPDARMIVIMDGFAPLPKTILDALTIEGVEVRTSTHPRNGNLIGTDHTLYHARLMNELATADDDIIIKIDPETLIFDGSIIDGFAKDQNAVLFGAFKQHINYMMGLFYAVKGAILPRYADDVEKFPSWAKCYEDFEVSSRIYRLTDRHSYAIMRAGINGRDGIMLCSVEEAQTHAKEVMQCKVINCGFGNKCGKDRIARFMQFIVNERSKK